LNWWETFFQVLVARIHVHGRTVGEFLAWAADHLLEMRLRLVKLVFLAWRAKPVS